MNSLRSGLHGHLDLTCKLDETGKSYLSRQSFRAPIHLSKPWLDDKTLIVHMVNPTAGLLAGDRIEIAARVESGASLVLTTPSASRAFRTLGGEITLSQSFEIQSGALLEVFPEIFIPQAGSRCSQNTRISIEPGGELLYIDILAPGRVAMGESFAYEQLDWRTDIRFDGKPVVRERSRMRPDKVNLRSLRQVFPNAYCATIWAIGARPMEIEKNLHVMQSSELWIGASRLSAGGWTVKFIAGDSQVMRRAISAARAYLYKALGRTAPDLRKI